MHDTMKIVAGLTLFILALMFPIWYSITTYGTPPAVAAAAPPKGQECVEPVNYMRTSHMELLGHLRDLAVREGKTVHTGTNGQQYEISMQNTCLACHGGTTSGQSTVSTRDGYGEPAFCASCHEYAGVRVDCWRCHLATKEGGS